MTTDAATDKLDLEHAGFKEEGAAMLREILSSLDLPVDASADIQVTGAGELPSVFAVTDLATASIGAASLAVGTLRSRRTGAPSRIRIDRELASLWFDRSIYPVGWNLPPVRDPIAGDYATSDGWIRLHTNAPLHRQAALRALGFAQPGADVTREMVAARVRETRARELEEHVIAAGGCAAEMRSQEAWANHPQGQAVKSEPLLAIRSFEKTSKPVPWVPQADRPLAGVRVLDLTRILAGPIATRFLASFGAEVLRIDPIDWDEPAAAPEVTPGKRRARLDLRSPEGRCAFESLLRQADVLVHGYRSDALERLGLGEARRRELNPGLVDACLDAYGWTGEWRTRRGFDSLVQMSSGIAHAGMEILGKPIPTPLPVQALDHATGYMLAAAVVRGLVRRLDEGRGSSTRASLARTAAMLTTLGPSRLREAALVRQAHEGDFLASIEQTVWGPARRLRPPYDIEGAPACWTLAAGNLGDGDPVWLSDRE